MSKTKVPFVLQLPSDFSLEMAFRCLCARPGCLWLDSSSRGQETDAPLARLSRYSFLTSDPIKTLEAWTGDASPWPTLHQWQRELPVNLDPDLPPFQGGIAGLWGYESATWLEDVGIPDNQDLNTPAVSLGLYDWVVASDHQLNTSWLICQGEFHSDWEQRCHLAAQRSQQMQRWLGLEIPLNDVDEDTKATAALEMQVANEAAVGSEIQARVEKDESIRDKQFQTSLSGIQSNFSSNAFQQAIAGIVQGICNGDSFQVNLAQRLLTEASLPSSDLYLKLRQTNPAPFSAYYSRRDFQVLSSSPEGFLQVRGEYVETRPIKGTVRRTGEPVTDGELAQKLMTSGKDRAENIMIVDLLRNDLSKVCEDDSVQVTQLCGLETYQHVQHLVSVVRGKLAKSKTASELLEACFPGGSVTGAPKVEAMKTIANLEPNPRGPYCGSIGYLGIGGQADFNILIRTVTAVDGYLQFPVGGGITARSEPAAEEAETWAKAEGMLRAILPERS